MSRKSPGCAVPGLPTTANQAIEVLFGAASASLSASSDPFEADAIRTADRVLRDAVANFETLQNSLTDALISNQDRILAMKSLANINVQGLASAHTIEQLLENARLLTSSTRVIIVQNDRTIWSAGSSDDLGSREAVAVELMRNASGASVRSAADDTVIVATVDPESTVDRHVAFFRGDDKRFSTIDIPLIEAIVAALSLMLAFDELHQRELERSNLQHEHELASTLAQSVIVDKPPRTDSAEIFARTVPASITGGDFYVFGQVGDLVWFAVGDVAGKGLPAAIIMTRAVSACRVAFLALRDASVVDVYARIEDELYDHLDEVGVFVTMAIGSFRESSREIELCNAGHSPVILVRQGMTGMVPATVPPLGVVNKKIPAVSRFTLEAGHALVLASDGLAEQSTQDGTMFGYDRFVALCEDSALLNAAAMGERIFEVLNAFAAGQEASDDATLVIIRCPTRLDIRRRTAGPPQSGGTGRA
ncbi:MAG: serine/threonine-protein phosphatase [Salinibacterium sp.]|nr:serine/threonine-protein phosphatase [Salinibacterium sp.]